MKTNEEIVRERLKATGIYCFILYFEVFRDNKFQTSNQKIIEAFAKNHEDWTEFSYQSRASKGKAIFRDGQEKIALKYIVNEASDNKVDADIMNKAKRLLMSVSNK